MCIMCRRRTMSVRLWGVPGAGEPGEHGLCGLSQAAVLPVESVFPAMAHQVLHSPHSADLAKDRGANSPREEEEEAFKLGESRWWETQVSTSETRKSRVKSVPYVVGKFCKLQENCCQKDVI